MGKYVFSFNEGTKDMREILGGKGANLSEMTRMGLPIPFGFIISTLVCNTFLNKESFMIDDIINEIQEKIKDLEEVTGKQFGDAENPLLVSVRSGSSISMPGMMDTILNLGLNDVTVIALSELSGDKVFALNSYIKFIEMYGYIVLKINKNKFIDIVSQTVKDEDSCDEVVLINNREHIIELFKELILNETGNEFPQDVKLQLKNSIMAIFSSWNNERAILYRRHNNIPNDLGTAAIVQAMVFGNLGKNSATGVAFTRNPINGEKALFGEFLIAAQGEDVVSGKKTPVNILRLQKSSPMIYKQMVKIFELLELHFKDMQDVEFTIENNKLYILQSKVGKRTINSSLKIAVDMVSEELITKEEAICRIDASNLNSIYIKEPVDDEEGNHRYIASGLPASLGMITGKIALTEENVMENKKNGISTIFVKNSVSSDDLKAIIYTDGILTAKGGTTSHIAVVARGMGKSIITGCEELIINEDDSMVKFGDLELNEGDTITICATTGKIYRGSIEGIAMSKNVYLDTLLAWTDNIKSMKIRANADTKEVAEEAIGLAADGIGLFRTENLFNDDDMMLLLRRLIFSECEVESKTLYNDLLNYQKEIYINMYNMVKEKPLNIRLLDFTSSDIIPKEEKELSLLARTMELTREELDNRMSKVYCANPILGFRGSRMMIKFSTLMEVQVEAVVRAVVDVKEKTGYNVVPEIMIPFVSDKTELEFLCKNIKAKINSVIIDCEAVDFTYQLGVMIETPRAALIADELAENVDFISFGTNDLTQLTYGISREESNLLIEDYLEKNIMNSNPFITLDTKGVGNLIEMAVERGRLTKPNLKIGICGTHGGDPNTIEFCSRLKFNYISSSTVNLSLARLVAAQTAIFSKSEDKELA